jgi:hypothetical protein
LGRKRCGAGVLRALGLSVLHPPARGPKSEEGVEMRGTVGLVITVVVITVVVVILVLQFI